MAEKMDITESVAVALDAAVRLARRDPSIGGAPLLALRSIGVLSSAEASRLIEVEFAEWGDFLRMQVTVRKEPLNLMSTELMWKATNIMLVDKRHGRGNQPVRVEILQPSQRYKFILNNWP